MTERARAHTHIIYCEDDIEIFEGIKFRVRTIKSLKKNLSFDVDENTFKIRIPRATEWYGNSSVVKIAVSFLFCCWFHVHRRLCDTLSRFYFVLCVNAKTAEKKLNHKQITHVYDFCVYWCRLMMIDNDGDNWNDKKITHTLECTLNESPKRRENGQKVRCHIKINCISLSHLVKTYECVASVLKWNKSNNIQTLIYKCVTKRLHIRCTIAV